MTHNIYLDQLLSNSIQKLNDFVDVLRMDGYNNAKHASALNEWEAAESMYTAHLNLIHVDQISPDAIAD